MSAKKDVKKRSGLGRSLGELLSDNEELGNVENKVLMHKDDGTTVKIYNKVDTSITLRKSYVFGNIRQIYPEV